MTTTTIETVAGPMVIDEDELRIGRFLDADGNVPTHDEVLAFMRRHIAEGDSVVDVGCNAGFFTLAMMEMVGDSGHVAAFDPNWDVLKNLASSLAQRDATLPVDVYTLAIGRAPDWGLLRFDLRGPGGTQVVPAPEDQLAGLVRVETLDDVGLRRPVSFIKIDTEGMDIDVLRGSVDILENDRPVVLFEWNTAAMQSLQKSAFDEMTSLCLACVTHHYIVCDYRTDTPLVVPFDHLGDGDYALIPEERVDGR